MQLNSYAPWFRWCSAFLFWWSNSPGFPSVSQGGCSLVLWLWPCSHAIREHLYNPSFFSGLPWKDNVCFVSVCLSLWLHVSKPFWLSRALGTEMDNKQPKLGKGGGDINLGIGNSGLKLQWDLFPASTAGKELFLLMCKYVASVCTLLLSQHLCLPYVFQVQRWKAFICSGLFLCHSFQNTSDRYKSSS